MNYLILSIFFIFDKALSNPSIFSLKAKLEIDYTAINNNNRGNEVITDALFFIKRIYIIINNPDLIKNIFLKTLIIESECLSKL